MSSQHHAPASLTAPHPGVHRTRDWVGPKAGVDVSDKKKHLLPVPRFEPLIAWPVA